MVSVHTVVSPIGRFGVDLDSSILAFFPWSLEKSSSLQSDVFFPAAEDRGMLRGRSSSAATRQQFVHFGVIYCYSSEEL